MNKSENDPLKKQQEVDDIDRGQGLSPMSPPEVGDECIAVDVPYEEMNPFLRMLMDEHRDMLELLSSFEEALVKIAKEKKIDEREDKAMKDFLEILDEEFILHNRKEEKVFFPILRRRLLEAGEHSKGTDLFTGTDILEAEHIDGMKMVAVLQTYLDVLALLDDEKKYQLVVARFIKLSNNLIEMLRTHIHREDKVIFGLSMKLLTVEDFVKIDQEYL